MTIEDRGYATPCWISNRAKNGGGYTKIGIDGRTEMTHRAAYTAFVGPIPAGLVIDHLCRERTCCNPEHLEAVTHRENLVRGETLTSREVAQTACKHGHPFTPENTYQRPDRPGRLCRTCRSEANTRHEKVRTAKRTPRIGDSRRALADAEARVKPTPIEPTPLAEDPDLIALAVTVGLASDLIQSRASAAGWDALTAALVEEHTPGQLANMLTGAAALLARAGGAA